MSEPCRHDLAEMEGECADGYCPICMKAENESLRQEVERRRALAEATQLECNRLAEDVKRAEQRVKELEDRDAKLRNEANRITELEQALAKERERTKRLEKAAKKCVSEWGASSTAHSIICNFQDDKRAWCNCGRSDLLAALRKEGRDA